MLQGGGDTGFAQQAAVFDWVVNEFRAQGLVADSAAQVQVAARLDQGFAALGARRFRP